MADKLTYLLITPYSLLKSRTGGIIGRILALSRDVRFVGARMYAPSDAMVDAYIQTLSAETHPPTVLDALRQYADTNLRRDNPFGISNRMMLLLFEGPDPIRSLREDVVGALSPDMRGDTIRGTYGDFVLERGKLAFFEPAVLMPTNEEANRGQLQVLADYAMSDGGILDHVMRYADRSKVQTTLVIIKPDNFMRRSSRPGNIIDMFSRTGLYVVAAKLLQMQPEQAEEFYGPLRAIFRKKLAGQVAERAGAALGETFGFPITDEMKAKVADALKDTNAEYEFSKIVNYMTGHDEVGEGLPADERGKCVALLYQGAEAIEKIRRRLGATNPSEAEDGTVRSVYGYDLMKNGAHASDSPESAERERKIIGLWEETESCDVKEMIESYLAKTEKA
jgi:nucleoside diphosphate kinase